MKAVLTCTKTLGKAICVALYGYFIALATKKKYIPLLLLVLMHLTEYVAIGRKVGTEAKLHPVASFFLCLSFGFTWWVPVKYGNGHL